MKMKSTLVTAVVMTALSLSLSCSYENDKSDTATETTPTTTTVYYSDVASKVFTPYCVACHSASLSSGGVALDTYAGVKANLAAIKAQAVTNGTMPPSGKLTTAEKSTLSTWIDAGGIEKAGASLKDPEGASLHESFEEMNIDDEDSL